MVEPFDLGILEKSPGPLERMSPDELLAYAIRRKKWFDLIKPKLDELSALPKDTRIVVSENGNYGLGGNVFEACDRFHALYPNDRSKKLEWFQIGDVL